MRNARRRQIKVIVQMKCRRSTGAGDSKKAAAGGAAATRPQSKMVASDVTLSLELLQAWLNRFAQDSKTKITTICEKMVGIARSLEARPVLSRKAALKLLPSSSQKRETIDDQRGSSATFLVLDTLVKMFETLDDQQSPRGSDALCQAPTTLVDFAFEKLGHVYTPAIRHAAARCLSMLTPHMTRILALLSSGLLKCAGSDVKEREFATRQRAVKFLHFSVGSSEAIGHTLMYLRKMSDILPKVTRGVLREEMCISFLSIFTQILDRDDALRASEYTEFATKRPNEMSQFWAIFQRVYSIVYKWARKDKHAIFSLNYLWQAACVSNSLFYTNPNREDFMRLIINGFGRNKEFRGECLKMVKNFLVHIPEEFIRATIRDFSAKFKTIVAKLYPKSSPNEAEVPTLIDILHLIGKRHTQFAVNSVLVPILRPRSGYHNNMKAVALRALAKMSSEESVKMESYHFTLGPILAPYIEEGKAGATLLSAALQCFPNVRHPDMELVRQTVQHVGRLTLHSEREIAHTAAMALQRFVLLDPEANLVRSIYYFIDLLSDFTISPQQVLKTCHNISYLFTAVDELNKKARGGGGGNAADEARYGFHHINAWITMREHIEGMCLLWMCHPESWVQAEVLRLLHQTTRQVFRKVEAQIMDNLRKMERAASGYLARTNDSAVRAASSTSENLLQDFLAASQDEAAETGDAGGTSGASGDESADEAEEERREKILSLSKHIGAELKRATARSRYYLADYLSEMKDMAGEDGPRFHPDLKLILTQHYEKFAGIVTWTFSKLYRRIEALLSKDHTKEEWEVDVQNPRWGLWVNHVNYLCLAMRNPVRTSAMPAKAGVVTVDQYDRLVSERLERMKAAGAAGTRGGAGHFDTPDIRPGLAGMRMSESQLQAFFEECHKILHLPAQETKRVDNYDRVCTELATALSQIHPSVYPELIQHVQKQRAISVNQRPRASRLSFSSSANLVEPDPKLEYTYHGNTLAIFARLFVRMSPEMYHSEAIDPIVRSCLGGLVKSWLTEKDAKMTSLPLPVGVRSNMARLLSCWLRYGTHPKPHSNDERQQILKMRPRVFRFLCGDRLLPYRFETLRDPKTSLADFDKMLRSLEATITESVRSLITIAPLEDRELEDMMLRFLHFMPYRGAHVDGAVQDAFRVFLANNPNRLRHFVHNCAPELHVEEEQSIRLLPKRSESIDQERNLDANPDMLRAKRRLWWLDASGLQASPAQQHQLRHSRIRQLQSSEAMVLSADNRHMLDQESIRVSNSVASKLATFYFQALVGNFSANIDKWVTGLHDPMPDGTGCIHPSTAILLSLLHQVTPNAASRRTALRLADLVAKRKRDAVDPGYPIRLQSHLSPFMYTQSALDYSKALSNNPRYYHLLNCLLTEVVAMNSYVSERNKELLLRALFPWIQHFGDLLSSILEGKKNPAAHVSSTARTILSSMLTISRQCHGSSMLTHLLNEMWVKLIDPKEHSTITVPEVVTFFLSVYRRASAMATEGKTRDDRRRGREDKATLKMVIVHLCRSENADMIIDALMKEFRSYPNSFPCDPQAFIKWKDTVRQAREDPTGSEISAFELVINLVFENGLRRFFKYIPTLLQNAVVLFGGSDEGHDMVHCVAMALWKDDASADFRNAILLKSFIQQLNLHYKPLRNAWAQMSFVWATNSADPMVASRSFKLFQKLHSFYVGHRIVIGLALSFYLALRNNEYSKVFELVQIFKLPSKTAWDIEGWQTLAACAVCLLRYSELRYYKLGLELLLTILSKQRPERAIKQLWLKQLKGVWCDRGVATDSGVTSVLFKGLGSVQTNGDSWSVLYYMAEAYSHDFSTSNRMMLALLLNTTMLALSEIITMEAFLRRAPQSDEQYVREQTKARAKVRGVLQTICAQCSSLLARYGQAHAEDQNAISGIVSALDLLVTALSNPRLTRRDVQSVLRGRKSRSKGEGSSYQSASTSKAASPRSPRSTFHFDEKDPSMRMVERAIKTMRPRPSATAMRRAERKRSLSGRLSRSFSGTLGGLPRQRRSGSVSLDVKRRAATAAVRDGGIVLVTNEFVSRLLGLFPSLDNFEFLMRFMTRQLEFGDPSWRHANLVMLQALLKASPHKLSAPQFRAVAELMVRHYYSVNLEMKQLAEDISVFVVARAGADGPGGEAAGAPGAFNFLRPRFRPEEPWHPSQRFLMTSGDEKYLAAERKTVLKKIEVSVFPLLTRINGLLMQAHTVENLDYDIKLDNAEFEDAYGRRSGDTKVAESGLGEGERPATTLNAPGIGVSTRRWRAAVVIQRVFRAWRGSQRGAAGLAPQAAAEKNGALGGGPAARVPNWDGAARPTPSEEPVEPAQEGGAGGGVGEVNSDVAVEEVAGEQKSAAVKSTVAVGTLDNDGGSVNDGQGEVAGSGGQFETTSAQAAGKGYLQYLSPDLQKMLASVDLEGGGGVGGESGLGSPTDSSVGSPDAPTSLQAQMLEDLRAAGLGQSDSPRPDELPDDSLEELEASIQRLRRETKQLDAKISAAVEGEDRQGQDNCDASQDASAGDAVEIAGDAVGSVGGAGTGDTAGQEE